MEDYKLRDLSASHTLCAVYVEKKKLCSSKYSNWIQLQYCPQHW